MAGLLADFPKPKAPALDLPQTKAQSILSSGPLTAPPTPAPQMREFGDARLTRQYIYEDALNAARNIEPIEDERYRLRLADVDWADPERFTRKQRKAAILAGDTLARRLRGSWVLEDVATGKEIQRRAQIVGRIPYLSSMGTFVHKGNEYTVNHQQRLRPGVFARVKDNGEIESHVNVLPGKGVSHRYFLDPEKELFKLRLGQAEMPLLPLVQALGATDKEVREAWGDQLFAANYKHLDSGQTIKKLAARLLRRADQGLDEGTTRQRLADTINRMELDPEVTKRTLGQPYANLNKEVILNATKKLIQVNRREVDPDDRDSLAYQQFFGPEDLFAERLRRDHGNLRKQLFRKIALAGNLDKMPSGALTPQVEQVLLGSGLAQALEEINPAEVFDKQSRITRMGEGGIPSLDAIPDEARAVQPSHMGFMDPLRTPESFRVGVDLHMARSSRKGRDGRIYTSLRDQQGNMVWKSPQDVAEASIATPDVLKWDTKRVPVMKGGKLAYVPKNEVDFVLPNFEDSFSPLGNMVPLKSMVKGQRVAMASRMLTQALPLTAAEAPLVQSGLPGSKGARSFEEEYGKHMGAVAADSDGRVVDVRDGVIKLKYNDGRTDEVELYENHPFNRKTYINQTAVVKPGDAITKGQLLAHSNYTDKTGATALGTNLNVAYWPYLGYNFEDAVVISESGAKKMSSEHMYQHDLEVTDKHKIGKRHYVNLFPGKFDKKAYENLDDDGIVRPGTVVNHGDPLILAARQKEFAQNKIHKKKQAGYGDESLLWKHHDPGVVTDVVWGKNGPVVLVKSQSQMQVGDKLSGRYGDKGVVAAIVPDSQMPHGRDGNPFELLLNPLGVISRTNPAQKVEAQLGKIARLTGKPVKVPDFEDEEDLTAWAQMQLRMHGLKDTEDIVWPEKNMKVPGIHSGTRFFMKLHHTAESKGQGRGGGSYSMDDTPAKGGAQGCFLAGTHLHTAEHGFQDIARIVGRRMPVKVLTRRPGGVHQQWLPVTDWFHYRVDANALVTLRLGNGREIHVTRNHEFVMADGTRKLAGDLVAGDDLMEV